MCAGVHECALVCLGVHGEYARVCAGVDGYAWVCVGMHGCTQVCTGVCVDMHGCTHYACVWDEFSEFLLKNRVPTSADFNTYPIRIFYLVTYIT